MQHPDDATALILAGGLGTRLRPVVPDGQKVVLPVCGRPFLHFLLDRLLEAGFRRAILCAGYRAEKVKQAIGDSYRGLALTYSIEPQPLGTAGALRYALRYVDCAQVAAMNGDSYCEVDWESFREFHRLSKARATILLTEVAEVGRYGRVRVDEKGRVKAFEEKGSSSGAGWINAGIYIMEREFLEAVPEGRPVSLEREIFPQAVGKGLYAFSGGGRFLDIGTPESYAEAQSFFKELKKR